MQEMTMGEVGVVGGGLTANEGGAIILGMAAGPVGIGVAAFAVTVGLGLIIGSAYYGSGGVPKKSADIVGADFR